MKAVSHTPAANATPYSASTYNAGGKNRSDTGQFADEPTRGQSSRGLVNSRISQLADKECSKSQKDSLTYPKRGGVKGV